MSIVSLKYRVSFSGASISRSNLLKYGRLVSFRNKELETAVACETATIELLFMSLTASYKNLINDVSVLINNLSIFLMWLRSLSVMTKSINLPLGLLVDPPLK